MNKIKADKVLFIKLGEKGKHEESCIENSQTLRLDYTKSDHSQCIAGKWQAIYEYFANDENTTQGTATNHTNQIKQFYTADQNTLWLTVYRNKLWWCFSKPEITLLTDSTKTRPVIGQWSDKDIEGNILFAGNISGKLLKTQGFRGTICNVSEMDYALKKINCEQIKEVVDVENAAKALKEKLSKLIQTLQWKDFETLVDLIFRQAGWQRLSETGKTQKTIDLELMAPVTGERAIVQIKSQSDIKEFQKYQADFVKMGDYDKFFFVVHTASKNLKEHKDDIILHVDKISELTISSGLLNWVIKRTS